MKFRICWRMTMRLVFGTGPVRQPTRRTSCGKHREMWGSLPYRKFVFLNLLTEARGGLEHSNSVCLMTSRWATRTRHGYLSWLNLVSHEFFHVWNIKRLRPVELGPFDYEKENYTRSLWIAEGITDYYAPLTVRRAGLSTTEEYLESLSETINKLQSTPGPTRAIRGAILLGCLDQALPA